MDAGWTDERMLKFQVNQMKKISWMRLFVRCSTGTGRIPVRCQAVSIHSQALPEEERTSGLDAPS
jgi:hypothetical protein